MERKTGERQPKRPLPCMRAHGRLAALLLLLGTAAPAPAAAQIVNVLSQANKATDGFHGAASLGADWRTGNTRLLVLRGSSTTSFVTGRHLLLLILKGDFGIQGDKRFQARTFEHLRYRVQAWGPLSFEVFGQHEHDQFRRISYRALVGVGPRVELASWDSGSLAAGSAFMTELERLREGSEPDAGRLTLFYRWSNYVTLVEALADRLSLSETVFCQPRFNDFADIRLLNELTVEVGITRTFSFLTSLTLAYDHKPPSGVERLDTALSCSIGAKY